MRHKIEIGHLCFVRINNEIWLVIRSCRKLNIQFTRLFLASYQAHFSILTIGICTTYRNLEIRLLKGSFRMKWERKNQSKKWVEREVDCRRNGILHQNTFVRGWQKVNWYIRFRLQTLRILQRCQRCRKSLASVAFLKLDLAKLWFIERDVKIGKLLSH